MSDAKTILLCGVGGQGTILAADLLARAASAAGLQVKVSEIHAGKEPLVRAAQLDHL